MEYAGRHAVVVDDGPVERMTGKALLGKLGFQVATASSGEEALQLLAQQPVDLVLCDISMPGMDGLALLQAASALPSPPLFIMASSHNESELAANALRDGASAYLTKPLRFDRLGETVREVLAMER